jgi:orotate phosphoribosyltransferase
MLRDHQITFLEVLLESQALRFGDFTLKSGRRSPYFINTGCFNTGATMDRLADCYVSRMQEIVEDGTEFDVVFGPAYKGIPLAVAIASSWNRLTGSDVGWCFNRKEAKDHGDKGRLVGAPIEGKRVLLVDDVLTAGTSMREALALIANVPDARPVGALISVDREERGQGDLAATMELQQEHGLPVHSIVGIGDAVAYLHENEVRGVRHVTDDAHALFVEYRSLYGVRSEA